MPNKRPKLKLPLTTAEKIFEIISMSIIWGTCFILFLNYLNLPDRIPTHFGASGQPDAWSGKTSLFALPIIMVVLYIGLTILGRFPHTYNYLCKITKENAPFQYLNTRMFIGLLKSEIILAFAYIEWATIQVAGGKAYGLGIGFLPVFLIIIFGTLAFFIIRMVRGK